MYYNRGVYLARRRWAVRVIFNQKRYIGCVVDPSIGVAPRTDKIWKVCCPMLSIGEVCAGGMLHGLEQRRVRNVIEPPRYSEIVPRWRCHEVVHAVPDMVGRKS